MATSWKTNQIQKMRYQWIDLKIHQEYTVYSCIPYFRKYFVSIYVCKALWLLITKCIVVNTFEWFLSFIIKWWMIGYFSHEILSPNTVPCTTTEVHHYRGPRSNSALFTAFSCYVSLDVFKQFFRLPFIFLTLALKNISLSFCRTALNFGLPMFPYD